MDALPLFHCQVAGASLLQAAFTQVCCSGDVPASATALAPLRMPVQAEAYAKTKDLVICGYYTANERENDRELATVAKAIGDKVASNCDKAWCASTFCYASRCHVALEP